LTGKIIICILAAADVIRLTIGFVTVVKCFRRQAATILFIVRYETRDVKIRR
jgi:hypothetical protein